MVVQEDAQVLGADRAAASLLIFKQQYAVLCRLIKGAVTHEVQDVASSLAQAPL